MWRIDWSKRRANDSQGFHLLRPQQPDLPGRWPHTALRVRSLRRDSHRLEPTAVPSSLQLYWQYGLKSAVRVCGPSAKVSWVLRPWFWVLWGSLLDEILHVCHLFCGNATGGCYFIIPFVPPLPLLQRELCCCALEFLWHRQTGSSVRTSAASAWPQVGFTCSKLHMLFPYKSVNIKKP